MTVRRKFEFDIPEKSVHIIAAIPVEYGPVIPGRPESINQETEGRIKEHIMTHGVKSPHGGVMLSQVEAPVRFMVEPMSDDPFSYMDFQGLELRVPADGMAAPEYKRKATVWTGLPSPQWRKLTAHAPMSATMESHATTQQQAMLSRDREAEGMPDLIENRRQMEKIKKDADDHIQEWEGRVVGAALAFDGPCGMTGMASVDTLRGPL